MNSATDRTCITPQPPISRTFSDPVKWIDRKNVIIDTTMLRDDDGWWYRASKDSEITIERTRNPYAVAREVLRTDDPNEWSFVGTLTDLLGNGRYSEHYLEGPELFVFNDDDVATVNGRPMRYGLMCDQYAEGKGYTPFRSADLGSHDPLDWAAGRRHRLRPAQEAPRRDPADHRGRVRGDRGHLRQLIRRINETHHADGTDRRPASRAIVGHRLIARESTGLTPC